MTPLRFSHTHTEGPAFRPRELPDARRQHFTTLACGVCAMSGIRKETPGWCARWVIMQDPSLHSMQCIFHAGMQHSDSRQVHV